MAIYTRVIQSASALLVLLSAVGNGVAADAQLPHVERSADLRTLMQRMEALFYEQNLTGLELDRERLRAAQDIARVGNAIAGIAATIPGTARSQVESADRAPEFRRLATQLAAEASVLARLAESGEVRALPAQYERVSHVCAACHSLYRP